MLLIYGQRLTNVRIRLCSFDRTCFTLFVARFLNNICGKLPGWHLFTKKKKRNFDYIVSMAALLYRIFLRKIPTLLRPRPTRIRIFLNPQSFLFSRC